MSESSGMSRLKRLLARTALIACVGLLGACRSWFGGGADACHKPAPYAVAEERPPLKIPPGLEHPDTSKALRIPELKVPEPPPRGPGDPCLDAPPPYAVPKPAPSPAA